MKARIGALLNGRLVLLCCCLIFNLSRIANSAVLEGDSHLGCPTVYHNYGPFDYRTATKEQKYLVESAHFFPNVENLKKGTKHKNRDYIMIPGDELDYTLRVFPNHHRALLALARLGELDRTDKPQGTKASIDCYFKYAINFRSDDAKVRVVYGIYLAKKRDYESALRQLNKAEELGDDSPNNNYNIGLIYFDLKKYDKSLHYAHRAYQGGFPLAGLREKLKKAGVWIDPKPQTTEKLDDSVADTGANVSPSAD